jgi:hypothetical protein
MEIFRRLPPDRPFTLEVVMEVALHNQKMNQLNSGIALFFK